MNRRNLLLGAAACCCCPTGILLAQPVAEEIPICTIIPPENILDSRAFAASEWPTNSTNEGAVLRSNRWNPKKRELRVAFYSYNRFAERVFNAARGWEQHMPLRFKLVALNDRPEIIVGFTPGDGHWSLVGTDSALYARQGRQTMNFGWTRRPSPEEIRRVALHEFGHALGLIHEQSTPGADISWNRQAVYEHYYRSQGWSPQQTEDNVLARYTEAQVNRTQYDPISIMHYPVPRNLVTDPNDAVGWNTKLSQADKAMAAWLWQ